MSRFSEQYDKYKNGQMTAANLVAWVAANINRHDSRLSGIPSATAEDWEMVGTRVYEIMDNPEPDTMEEVDLIVNGDSDLPREVGNALILATLSASVDEMTDEIRALS